MAARHYLDHASTAPLRPAVLDAMLPFLREHHADPGRLHAEGLQSRVAVETAREQLADLVGAAPREVVFSASGSEAINHAVAGAVARAGTGHVVTTGVEHSAVLEAAQRASSDITVVGVDRAGRVDPDAVVAALRTDTVLVSIQTANHEVGTLQPAADIVRAARDHGALTHVDACASFGRLPLSFAELGADLCSITAHKVGGPKGAAALLVRRGLRIPPLVVGGAQERARRAGLENVPAIVGFGALAAVLADTLDTEAHAQSDLVERAATVLGQVDDIARYGDPTDRLPHILCLGVGGVEAEPILLELDRAGIATHSGSSCSSEALEPSPVLEAMGVDAQHSLRVSVGWSSTVDDVDAFVAALPGIVGRLRALRASYDEGRFR